MITAGLVDRAIDEWEKNYGRSTVKNTVSALVLVLDEAVRDGIIVRNPAKDRARRKTVGRSFGDADHEPPSPRERPHGRLVVVGHRGDVVPAITHPPVHSHRQPRAHLHGVLDALPMAERLGCEVTLPHRLRLPHGPPHTARDRPRRTSHSSPNRPTGATAPSSPPGNPRHPDAPRTRARADPTADPLDDGASSTEPAQPPSPLHRRRAVKALAVSALAATQFHVARHGVRNSAACRTIQAPRRPRLGGARGPLPRRPGQGRVGAPPQGR